MPVQRATRTRDQSGWFSQNDVLSDDLWAKSCRQCIIIMLEAPNEVGQTDLTFSSTIHRVLLFRDRRQLMGNGLWYMQQCGCPLQRNDSML